MFADSEEVQEEGTVRTTKQGLRRKFEAMAPMRIAIEVGTHSRWVSEVLSECGHEVLTANARKLALISKSLKKNDRIDAQTLGYFL